MYCFINIYRYTYLCMCEFNIFSFLTLDIVLFPSLIRYHARLNANKWNANSK